MQDKIKLLAQEAGFCFFSPEEDELEPIDWSCDYGTEFNNFVKSLIIKKSECVLVQNLQFRSFIKIAVYTL